MGMFDNAMKMVYYKSNPEWYYYDENDFPQLTDKAPPEAVESYNFWKERYEEQKRTGIIYN